MRTSRISNALIAAVLSTPLAFASLAPAGPKDPPEAAAQKETAEESESPRRKVLLPAKEKSDTERKTVKLPTKAERQQQQQEKQRDQQRKSPPAKPRPPAVEPVTFLGIAAAPVGDAVRAQLDLPAGVGIAVGDVFKDSPAAKGGIVKFDVLTKLDDQILVSGEQLQTLVRMKNPGDQVTVTLLRSAKEKTVKVKLDSHRFPAPAMTQDERRGPRFGAPRPGGPRGPQAWEDRWKELGERWSRGMEEWLEEHGDEWEENARKFLEDTLGDPDTWEPKMKKWLEEFENEQKPRLNAFARQFASVHATIVDEDGKVELTMKNGKKHVTATDPDGKVIFEGFCETDAERKKVPAEILEKVDSVKVDVTFDTPGELKKNLKKPPAKPAPKKSGGKEKDDAV